MISKQIDKAFSRSDVGRAEPPGAAREVWLAHEVPDDAEHVLGIQFDL
jgi:hypothetical protein